VAVFTPGVKQMWRCFNTALLLVVNCTVVTCLVTLYGTLSQSARYTNGAVPLVNFTDRAGFGQLSRTLSEMCNAVGQSSLTRPANTQRHSVLTAIFPGEPGLAGCPLNSVGTGVGEPT